MLNACVAVNTKRVGKWSNSVSLNTKSHYQLYMYDHNITLCSRMIFLQYPIITPEKQTLREKERERERETRIMQVRELSHSLVRAQISVQFCAIIPTHLIYQPHVCI
jgi:hypothetical protein